MTKLRRAFVALIAAALSITAPAAAQVTPGLTAGCSSPPPAYGVVWTASQWIVCLSSLQPFLGYTPLNQAGGTMSGELGLSPSVTTNAPLNFQVGVAPTSPVNGDLWFTSSGLFYRAGGVSIGPLASTTSPTLDSPTFTGTVTFPDSTTWNSTSISAGTALQALFASPPDIGGTVSGFGKFTALGIGTDVSTGGLSLQGSSGVTAGSSTIVIDQDGASAARFYSYGTDASTNGSVDFYSRRSDGTNSRIATLMDSSGNAILPGSVTLGASPTLTTASGSLTISSGGGTSTSLSDSTVTLSNAGYHTCDLLGTDGSGHITCGGAPSGYITYNDNVTTNTAAVSGNLYCMNTGSAPLTLTLPATPGNGNYVAFSDCGGNFNVNALTIARNGSDIMYSAGDMTVSTRYAGAVLRYSAGQSSWILSPL